MRTLIIDNYDSYTFNLYQFCVKATQCTPVVIRNDQFQWDHIRDNFIPFFDNIILSPGPGSPHNLSDFGVCGDILLKARIPIFGVCLGHQGMASVFGGKVIRAPFPRHGVISKVFHNWSPSMPLNSVLSSTFRQPHLFNDIPSPFNAVRYHSLVVDLNSLPTFIKPIAYTYETVNNVEIPFVMALEHTEKPIWGVQFHPESICTEFGLEIVKNFMELTQCWWSDDIPEYRWQRTPNILLQASMVPKPLSFKNSSILGDELPKNKSYTLNIKKLLQMNIDTLTCFEKLFNTNSLEEIPSIWLDSAKVEKGMSRFSFMGNIEGNQSFMLRYNTLSKTIRISKKSKFKNTIHDHDQIINLFDNLILDTKAPTSLFEWMQNFVDQFDFSTSKNNADVLFNVEELNSLHSSNSKRNVSKREIPFDFLTGFCGYFGYEMKHETLPPVFNQSKRKVNVEEVPDASFLFLDRILAFDHETNDVWILEIVERTTDDLSIDSQWVSEMIEKLYFLEDEKMMACLSSSSSNDLLDSQKIQSSIIPTNIPKINLEFQIPLTINETNNKFNKKNKSNDFNNLNLTLNIKLPQKKYSISLSTPSNEYKQKTNQARSLINQGETYEVCLTTSFIVNSPSLSSKSFTIYKDLRSRNPAPYACYFKLTEKIRICSSSPERFLKVCDGRVSMKPIKGTVARVNVPEGVDGEERRILEEEDERRRIWLEGSEKNRAENLMIVDLIRNDLNLISELDSVHVPNLMKVESFETVHQLVTTVEGTLRSDLSSFDAINHTFPPGSMTGAPKKRTVEILDDLEDGVKRGVYSGCIGYISVVGIGAEMSVVIRTGVFNEDECSVGAGGAIISVSDVDGEFEEMCLKAESVLPSIRFVLDNL